jgi:bifunctional non-homologous end joining protein LigD/DNA ligase-1
MDIFESKNIKPMLIEEMQEAFDSLDYIFELKLDGVRCLAYLDDTGVDLRNKRNLRVASIYPELQNINKQVKKKCILDGELVVMNEGRPDFPEMQRRTLMTNKFRIELAASKLPISFIAYDIVYVDDKQVTDLALMERKKLLQNTVKENERLAVSRFIEEKGIELYALTVEQNLEGIVAKRKDSKYYFGKKSKDWIKIKYLKDDDYVICGYIEKANNALSIILAQYHKDELTYKGHVMMAKKQDYITITSTKAIIAPDFPFPKGNEDTVWIEPKHVCTVSYMVKSETGALRQPVYKGLRKDKSPRECVEANLK